MLISPDNTRLKCYAKKTEQGCSQLSDKGASFTSDFGPFRGLKIESSQWLSEETAIFTIMSLTMEI